MGNRMISESALERIEKEYQEWLGEYQNATKKMPERLERFSTVSDMEIKPLYTPLDIKDKDFFEDIGFPGGIRSPAGCRAPCTARGYGPCACLPAWGPPKTRTTAFIT